MVSNVLLRQAMLATNFRPPLRFRLHCQPDGLCPRFCVCRAAVAWPLRQSWDGPPGSATGHQHFLPKRKGAPIWDQLRWILFERMQSRWQTVLDQSRLGRRARGVTGVHCTLVWLIDVKNFFASSRAHWRRKGALFFSLLRTYACQQGRSKCRPQGPGPNAVSWLGLDTGWIGVLMRPGSSNS